LVYASQAPNLLGADEGTDVSHNRLAEGTYVPALHMSTQEQKRERGLKKKQYKLTGLEFFLNANTPKKSIAQQENVLHFSHSDD
jgi:hypothetical protein